jgi:YesN/AraC family two-component response regulator
MLSLNGYDVVEAATKNEGIAFYRRYNPDLVLTDILMPEMEGLETIKSLMELSPHLPVIAIAGSSDTPFVDVALKLGASCGLYKPFKQAELIETVSQYIN